LPVQLRRPNLPNVTSDAELYLRARRLLRAEAALFGSSADGARALQLPGVLASINPAAPDRSMFNWVIAEDPRRLFSAYEELARCYAEAGVRAWTVWSDEADLETAAWVTARGHKLDAKPRAMAADIAALSLPEIGDLAWHATTDMGVVAAINDAAYDFPPPAFRAALQRNEDPRWHAYVATRGEGEPVGCVLSYESVDGDCGISGVATLPATRGTGLASRLLSVAITQAMQRGAHTTSLQATSKGAPVYARLGYRDLGALIMWEHRTPPPSVAG
jgi:ribosomal protein S18 acetylase RimI-like enzyme